MADDDFKRHLNERRGQNYASTRLWNKDPDKLGMEGGERMLAWYFGAEPDLRNRPGGDKGIDLELLLCFEKKPEWSEWDVKTANKPGFLLVNTKDIKPHRGYALCAPWASTWELLGWEWGYKLMLEPSEWWSGNDALVHYKARYRLERMDTLKGVYCGQWRHHGLEARPANYNQPRPELPPQPEIQRPKPPDLQEWIAKYGGYWNIPWKEYDDAMRLYHEKRRFGDSE
jgi:hypothetical protein